MKYIRIFLFLSFGLITSCESGRHDETAVIEYVKQKLNTKSVNIVIDSSKTLTTTSSSLIGNIANNFAIASVEKLRLETDRQYGFETRSDVLSSWLGRSIPRIIFIDDDNVGGHVQQKLFRFLDFLIGNSVESTRPRCLFFIITTDDDNDYLAFFEYAWSNFFLYITLIEINKLKSRSFISKNVTRLSQTLRTMMMHQYNPFSDTLISEGFTNDVILFKDKLQNLYGKELRAYFFHSLLDSRILRTSETSEPIEIYGSQIEFLVISSSHLNFKFTLVSSYEDEFSALKNNEIDFCVNKYTKFSDTTLDNLGFEIGDVLKSHNLRIITKLYPQDVYNVPYDFIILVPVIIFIIIVIVGAMESLRGRNNIWTIPNTVKLLFGFSWKTTPSQFPDRIIFIFVTILSSSLIAQLLNQLINLCLVVESFKKIEFLQELIDRNFSIGVDEQNSKFLASSNYAPMEGLWRYLNTSNQKFCSDYMLNGELDGCALNEFGLLWVMEYIPKRCHGWIPSIVEESLLPGYESMIFSRNSPYVHRFNELQRRLFESGLPDFINKQVVRITPDPDVGNDWLEKNSNDGLSEIEIENAMYNKLSSGKLEALFIIGCSLSFIIFAFELIWAKYGRAFLAGIQRKLRLIRRRLNELL